MKSARILAVVLGAFLASAVGVAVLLLVSPRQADSPREARGKPVPCEYFSSEEIPRPPSSRGMTLTLEPSPDPLVEVLVDLELGKNGKTVFARFGDQGYGTRELFFLLAKNETLNWYAVEAHARFDTDYGGYLGAVRGDSEACVHDDQLWFDLRVERLDGSNSIERWQGTLDLK